MSLYQTQRPTSSRKPAIPRADWLAWSLHLAFGLLLGFFIGLWIGGRMVRLRLIDAGQWPLVTVAVALFVGAISSHRGDRMWFRPSVFDPEPPPRSKASGTVSTIIGSVGGVLFALAIFWHVSAVSPSSHHVSLTGAGAFLLLFPAAFAFLVIRALQTGRILVVDRDEQPLWFWCSVALSSLGLLASLLSLFR